MENAVQNNWGNFETVFNGENLLQFVFNAKFSDIAAKPLNNFSKLKLIENKLNSEYFRKLHFTDKK